MGQPDLASNSLTSYADVFADIINAVIYGGKPVLLEQNLKPFYMKSINTRGGMEVNEVAEALYQWGREDSRAEIARKDAAIAKMKSDNAERTLR